MTVEIAGRYDLAYREPELRLICSRVLRGASLAFVGVSGVGKSNLVNFLDEGGAAAAGLLTGATGPVHFALAQCNTWQETSTNLWEIMLRALERVPGFPAAPADPVLTLNDAARSLRRLQSWVRLACHERGCHLVFVLDHFDRVLEAGPLSMLEELASLRNDGGRDRLSYLIFTNRLPHVLGREHGLDTHSKFYDLFRRDIYSLEPYLAKDAIDMLVRFNASAEPPLTHRDLHAIYGLAGGHGRLLKAIFCVYAEHKAAQLPLPGDPDKCQAIPEVNDTCRRIFAGLHEQEQDVLVRAAQNRLLPEDADTVDHLVRRGLLQSVASPTVFSPVMSRFVSRHGARPEGPQGVME